MEDKKQLEEGPKYEGQKEPPKMSKNAKAIKEFTDIIMKEHKDIIKSMWLFSVEEISK